MIGGAIGNVIDRLLHGHVIDFIQWYWRDHYWPAFNIADSAIVAGAVGIALFGLLRWQARGRRANGVKSPHGRPARQSPRFLRRRRPRDRDRQARARDAGRADLRAPRGRAQPLRGRRPQAPRRGLRRGTRRSARRRHRDLQRARRLAGRAQRSRAARAEGVRRHLPAGDQGAPGSRAPLPRRPRRGADRPRRPSRKSKARWASGTREAGTGPASTWSRTSTTSRRSRSTSPDNLAYTTQTTLSVDDTRDVIEALQGASSRRSRGRRTTTSATPPRTARTPCANWPRECDLVLVVGSPNSSNSNRLRELAEREGVEAYLIDGASRDRPALGAGPPAHRRHRRRLGAGRAGARRDRAPARTGRRARAPSCDGEPEDMVFALPKELRLQLVD